MQDYFCYTIENLVCIFFIRCTAHPHNKFWFEKIYIHISSYPYVSMCKSTGIVYMKNENINFYMKTKYYYSESSLFF